MWPPRQLLTAPLHATLRLPPSTAVQGWVASIVTPTISNRSFLKQVFTFQGAHPSSCSLKSFTYEKLCVPKVSRPVPPTRAPNRAVAGGCGWAGSPHPVRCALLGGGPGCAPCT